MGKKIMINLFRHALMAKWFHTTYLHIDTSYDIKPIFYLIKWNDSNWNDSNSKSNSFIVFFEFIFLILTLIIDKFSDNSYRLQKQTIRVSCKNWKNRIQKKIKKSLKEKKVKEWNDFYWILTIINSITTAITHST